MGRVFIPALGLEVVLQTRLPQRHQCRPVALDGVRLSDGRGNASNANLHHRLIIVVGQIVLTWAKHTCVRVLCSTDLKFQNLEIQSKTTIQTW